MPVRIARDLALLAQKVGRPLTRLVRLTAAPQRGSVPRDRFTFTYRSHPWTFVNCHQAGGCQPASAHNSPLTAELEIMKQIASAISSGRIRRRSCVYGNTFLSRKSSPSALAIGVSVKPG